ncbi:adenosylcobalamin-dependent ribonucleoside-diphosphate reductase [Dehalogenimonas sp. 4OHTPN]|uniref:Vitamin B12-dependent ribonucleotide reductase n=1 Tax=Dehalogenimonas sp. 4OHTPN TaxID=3166643 RepID=A0AAU8G8B3_9CHLR
MVIDTRSMPIYLDKPALTPNAKLVLEKRYLRRDENGEIIETPDEMFWQVARAAASVEQHYDPQADIETVASEFYEIMAGLLFLPNSPALLNAGTGRGQMAGSMVLPVEDSLDSIFDAVKNAAIIHQRGSGIGFDFSSIRPRGDRAGSRPDAAIGPVALIEVFSRVTQNIRQGGIRRGCNAVSLGIDHPDIIEFIRAKADQSSLSNFYTCIAITDDFMQRVKQGLDYPLIHPRTQSVSRWLNAREVFDQIVDQAWRNGEPGFIFLDRINRDNPTPQLGTLHHVSGCGEQPLLPNEFAHLGSVNLSRIVKSDGDQTYIDFKLLASVVGTAVRFLDNLIDLTGYPTNESMLATKRTRKIGLGVMGFADMLFQLEIAYNSEQALDIAREVMSFIQRQALDASIELGQKRGPYPAFHGGGKPIRNASRTTIAPTGTISLIAGCTSSIEPVFATVFIRNAFKGEHQMLDINPHFEKAARQAGVFTSDLIERLVRCNHLQQQPDVPEELKRIFVTAHRVSPEWHIKMQAAFQEFTDAAVSKTVNLPHNADREELGIIFMQAYDIGLKGITAYRDQSRSSQPFCTGDIGISLVREYMNCR